ncbi:hypothetical protein [Rhodohalobacter sp. 614A]|uniref:hypothetical protein n=1 Tax=Rhodohalobacter sp. 614A TaxID=2908649 RepID=UPI001F241824|nr:hypothetical protein [Rhodohalobacter sp. 614A]
MALYNYLNRIERLDVLIRQKRTGPLKELAEKLGISERWLCLKHNWIARFVIADAGENFQTFFSLYV